MRVCAVGARGDDVCKRQLVGAVFPHCQLELERGVALRHADVQLVHELEEGFGRDLLRRLHELDFLWLLHGAQREDVAMTLDELDLGVLLDERAVQGKRDIGVDEYLAALQARAFKKGGDELCRRHALVVDLPDALVLGARAHRRRVAHVGMQGARGLGHDRDVGLLGVEDPLEAGEPHEVGR